MTFEDPFFVVKDEVCKALNKTRGLYRRWLELQDDTELISKDELEWTITELRNSLRSIEWDLEDLEDTISIVEKNPSKFKIDNRELSSRRSFIEQTKDEVKSMKDKLNITRGRDRDCTARQPILESSPPRAPITHGTTKYSKLENEIDSPHRSLEPNIMLQSQEEQIDVNNLKTVSHQIPSELDEQAVMLDEFGHEMLGEESESIVNTAIQKISRTLRHSKRRNQGIAVLTLSSIVLLIIIILIML